MYSEYFIDKLDSNQSKTGYVNTKNGFYVCRNTNQIPVIYDVHVTNNIEGWRFKTTDGYNGIELISCSANKSNGYFTINCEKAS